MRMKAAWGYTASALAILGAGIAGTWHLVGKVSSAVGGGMGSVGRTLGSAGKALNSTALSLNGLLLKANIRQSGTRVPVEIEITDFTLSLAKTLDPLTAQFNNAKAGMQGATPEAQEYASAYTWKEGMVLTSIALLGLWNIKLQRELNQVKTQLAKLDGTMAIEDPKEPYQAIDDAIALNRYPTPSMNRGSSAASY